MLRRIHRIFTAWIYREGASMTPRRAWLLGAVFSSALALVLAQPAAGSAAADRALLAGTDAATTAWSAGEFHLYAPGVVNRSDIILGQADAAASQSMPLGNGTLGAGVWNPATGFTAQLNRQDTLPDWLSPGWLVIPGLAQLTTAADFSGRLDLYHGLLTESGGGMTLTAYIRADKDEMVVNVTGANPSTTQTAWLELWQSSARSVSQSSGGSVATLSSTWTAPGPGGTGQETFGMMSGITAGGRDVTAASVNSGFPAGSAAGAAYGARVSFQPNTDGSFRVVVVSPHWTGGDAQTAATTMLGQDATMSASALDAAHLQWWHNFWDSIGLMELSSSDGAAQYFENLRIIDLYAEAGENRDIYPGDSSGVALLYRDQEDYTPYGTGAWWQWNNRMQVDANMGAGAFSLNDPYFNLYTSNLANIEAWTRAQDPGKAGACVPETMTYNGTGAALTWDSPDPNDVPRCSTTASAFYNTRTITTGAEVSLWIWQQYLDTNDLNFLRQNFPLMAAAAQFLLSYTTTGATDGLLHTYPSNAHESQWDVRDPTTDIAAETALFPAVAQAATVLGEDPTLVSQLQTAETKIEPFARVPDTSTGTDHETMNATLCNDPPDSATASAEQASALACDKAGTDMLWYSYDVDSTAKNVENIGLEPVWPYGVIGDDTVLANGDNLTALAQRTYTYRTNQPGVSCSGCTAVPAQGSVKDWQTDALEAARLGMATQFESALEQVTEQYSTSPSAMGAGTPPFYEQIGTVAAAMQEALVQDYDGLLRIAPAWPSAWNAAGTVFIQGGSRVDVQIAGGQIGTVAIQAGSTGQIHIRNPWPGQSTEVVDGTGESTVIVPPTSAADFTIPVTANDSYLVQRTAAPVSGMAFQEITGTPSTAARSLSVIPPLEAKASGTAHIGLAGPNAPPPVAQTVTSAADTPGPGSPVRAAAEDAAPDVPAPTRTVVTSLDPDTAAGQPATFAATVTQPGGPPGRSPAGRVQFYADGSPVGAPVTLTGGRARLTTGSTSPQARSVTAEYLPAAGTGLAPSGSLPVTQQVSAPVTTIRLAFSGPARGGRRLVTATVTSSDGSVPTGTVQFYSGAEPVASPVALHGGTATAILATAARGPRLSASYQSDSTSWPDSMSGLLPPSP
jgi:hypothetical protein